jgi:signal transduction histidine kinase
MAASKTLSDNLTPKKTEQIRLRILLPMVAAMALLSTVFALGLYEEQRSANERSIIRSSKSVQSLLNDNEKQCMGSMSITLQELLNDDRLADALRDRNTSILSQRTAPVFENLNRIDNITHFRFYSRERSILLQSRSAGGKTDAGKDTMLLEAERTGKSVSGLEKSPQGSFLLRAISPWNRDGQRVGYVELGVDLHDILISIHNELQMDLFVAVDKNRLQRAEYEEAPRLAGGQNSWAQFADEVVTDKTSESIPETAQTCLRQSAGAADRKDKFLYGKGTVSQIMFLPLNDSEGRRLGELVVLRDVSKAIAEAGRWKLAIAMVCLGVCAALTAFFYRYLGGIEMTLAEKTVKLREANEQLEARVELRTSELQTANAELQDQMKRREQTQQELVASQKQLLAASRQAGKAEVAIGVLHNVGNVLNSINVSASVLMDRVAHFRVDNIARVGALLQQPAGELANYLTKDEKGRQVPGFLIETGAALVKDRQLLKDEICSLRKNIEHVNAVVSMQQNHAKIGGILESCEAREIVEEAIQLNFTSLQRHAIDVRRDFRPMPPILTDRHKVLQILINLIANSKKALDQKSGDRQIVISIAPAGAERVKITIADNGAGIAPENLTRIFSHGFTTRSDGHGFGLHSGALTARELSGALTAQSPGLGCGATFILEIPIAASATQGAGPIVHCAA